MFMDNLPKRDPCLENFRANIWVKHTCTSTGYVPPSPGVLHDFILTLQSTIRLRQVMGSSDTVVVIPELPMT